MSSEATGTPPVAMADARVRRLERMTADYWRQVTRTGGAYVPPKRMSTGMDSSSMEMPERSSEAYQRLSWDALRRSLNGLINKVNASNLREIVRELIGENLVRGRGLFARAIMKAQAASLLFTPVYAALVAVLNTKFPMLGELLAARLITQFRRSYRRNDKGTCVACTTFLAHLVNQHVLHDICVLQMLMLLLERPTDDSVEIAVALMKEVGASLTEASPKPTNAIFERFRAVLHEGAIDKRVQYMIEVLFQVRKESFREHPPISEELDLVEEADQITHYLMLDDEDLDTQDALNVFRVDPDFVPHEEDYEQLKKEILGDTDEEEEAEEANEGEGPGGEIEEGPPPRIQDRTDAELINFRKTVYLTIQSSLDFEECGHKLLKMDIPEELEPELCRMIIECCSNEKQYLRYHGLLAERFCKIDAGWREHFERCFGEVYATIHRLETNRIRNVAKLFGHLFESDAITWAVLECVQLTEEDTTAASRIFIKFLFQDLAEYYGVAKLAGRLREPDFVNYFAGLFPVPPLDAGRLRFSINFFTAIGLGGLTDVMREQLREVEIAEMATIGGLREADYHEGSPDRINNSEYETERMNEDDPRYQGEMSSTYLGDRSLRHHPVELSSRYRHAARPEGRSPSPPGHRRSREIRPRSRSRSRSRSASRNNHASSGQSRSRQHYSRHDSPPRSQVRSRSPRDYDRHRYGR